MVKIAVTEYGCGSLFFMLFYECIKTEYHGRQIRTQVNKLER